MLLWVPYLLPSKNEDVNWEWEGIQLSHESFRSWGVADKEE